MPQKYWTSERNALLGTDSDPAIAERLGIPKHKVFEQRHRLGISPFGRNWGETELAILRGNSDQEVARLTGRSIQEVKAKRGSLRVN